MPKAVDNIVCPFSYILVLLLSLGDLVVLVATYWSQHVFQQTTHAIKKYTHDANSFAETLPRVVGRKQTFDKHVYAIILLFTAVTILLSTLSRLVTFDKHILSTTLLTSFCTLILTNGDSCYCVLTTSSCYHHRLLTVCCQNKNVRTQNYSASKMSLKPSNWTLPSSLFNPSHARSIIQLPR